MDKMQINCCMPNSREEDLTPQMPTNEEIAKAIQDYINNNPNAFLGVMNLDGSLNCKLTVKAKGYKEF